MALTVDPATGARRELRRTPRGDGARVMVTHDGWSMPADIAPPAGAQAPAPAGRANGLPARWIGGASVAIEMRSAWRMRR